MRTYARTYNAGHQRKMKLVVILGGWMSGWLGRQQTGGCEWEEAEIRRKLNFSIILLISRLRSVKAHERLSHCQIRKQELTI